MLISGQKCKWSKSYIQQEHKHILTKWKMFKLFQKSVPRHDWWEIFPKLPITANDACTLMNQIPLHELSDKLHQKIVPQPADG